MDSSPERKCEIDNLEQAMREAQRMRSISLVACGLVHDFKNALTVMIGQAEIMLKLDLEDDKDRLEKIISAGRRAADFSARLLNVSRSSFNKEYAVDISPLIKESTKLLNASFRGKARFSTVKVEDCLHTMISAAEIHQILFNLCINAVEAMPEPGLVEIMLEREKKPTDSSDDSPGWAILTVRDNGVGIGEEERKSLFNPFYTTKKSGTGLGLTIVKSIVEESGGWLKVESTLGHGSEFKVALPLTESSIARPEDHKELHHGRGETVVVIENDAEILEILDTMLKSFGYRPAAFTTALDAENYLLARAPEVGVILLDAEMEGERCVRSASSLRKASPGMPIILMSSSSGDPAVEDALVVGFAEACVTKPLFAGEVLSTLESFIRHPSKKNNPDVVSKS